jgi:hypothetical protein
MAEVDVERFNEIITLNDIIMPDDRFMGSATTDANWWYEQFPGFESEVYLLLETDDVSEEQMQYLITSFEERQQELVDAFEKGGRVPNVELASLDEELDWDCQKSFSS